ncbi:MAG: hypothetical protein GY795_27360 [Desulfobacterales bacterium]|nr:hypothetical protein [Desulfobacterales bacterium]
MTTQTEERQLLSHIPGSNADHGTVCGRQGQEHNRDRHGSPVLHIRVEQGSGSSLVTGGSAFSGVIPKDSDM